MDSFMSEVLVSVILPVYNCEKYIGEAVESILNQTYSQIEFIIINDGSTDNTHGIIAKYSDNRIRYFYDILNRGIVYALNKGINESNGFLIFRMDADDISLPDRIADQVKFMQLNPSIDLLGSKAFFFTDDTISSKEVHGNSYNSHQVIKTLLFLYSPFIHPTIVIRNSIKNKPFLYYSEDSNYGDDYELFTRNADNLRFGFFDKVVLKYRIHISEFRLSSSHKAEQYKLSTSRSRLKYFAKNIPNFNTGLVVHYENIFYNSLKINLVTLKKTILFFLYFKDFIQSHEFSKAEQKFMDLQINRKYYNSIYQFSKIGFNAFILYWKYSIKLGRFHILSEIKFFSKSILKK